MVCDAMIDIVRAIVYKQNSACTCATELQKWRKFHSSIWIQ